MCDALERASATLPPFPMRLRGTATFRPVSPVVFVAVSQGISYTEMLAKSVRTALGRRRAGVPVPSARDGRAQPRRREPRPCVRRAERTSSASSRSTSSRSTSTRSRRAGSRSARSPSVPSPARRRSSSPLRHVVRWSSSSALNARAASGSASELRCASAMTRSSGGLSSWVARSCGPVASAPCSARRRSRGRTRRSAGPRSSRRPRPQAAARSPPSAQARSVTSRR